MRPCCLHPIAIQKKKKESCMATIHVFSSVVFSSWEPTGVLHVNRWSSVPKALSRANFNAQFNSLAELTLLLIELRWCRQLLLLVPTMVLHRRRNSEPHMSSFSSVSTGELLYAKWLSCGSYDGTLRNGTSTLHSTITPGTGEGRFMSILFGTKVPLSFFTRGVPPHVCYVGFEFL